MKGVLNIEFIVAVVVFMSTISFISVVIISNVPFLHQEAITENLKSRAYQASHTLIFDKGLSDSGSEDWNRINVVKLGLSSGEPYVLDWNKVNELNIMCNENYDRVRDSLTDYKSYITIKMSYLDGTPIIDCKPGDKEGVESIVKRFVFVNGEIARFEVSLIGI